MTARDWLIFAANVLVIWPLATLFTLAGILVGIPVVAIAAMLGRYTLNEDANRYEFTDRWVARTFSTPDNGCLPLYYRYRHPDWYPMWLSIVLWCGLRNAFAGNPLHVYGPGWRFVGSAPQMDPHTATIDHFRKTGEIRGFYNIGFRDWRAGIWWARLIGPRGWKAFDRWNLWMSKLGVSRRRPPREFAHWEIRFGWKVTPWKTHKRASYSPWDCGPRLS